jgi:hypothetical protein
MLKAMTKNAAYKNAASWIIFKTSVSIMMGVMLTLMSKILILNLTRLWGLLIQAMSSRQSLIVINLANVLTVALYNYVISEYDICWLIKPCCLPQPSLQNGVQDHFFSTGGTWRVIWWYVNLFNIIFFIIQL